MELRHLRYFVAVAQELNFTRAARKLHTSQPSLSSQIRDLEQGVGATLLVRDKRQVTLTAAGAGFLEDALHILQLAEQAQMRARQVMRNDRRLAIGFVPAAEVHVLPHVLPELRLKQPDTRIELVSLITTQQEDKLVSGELDIGFMRHPVVSDALEHWVVFREPLAVVMPGDHPLAARQTIHPDHLNGVDFVATDPAYSGQLSRLVDEWCASHACQPAIVQVATNILVTMNLVGMGLGVSLVPGYVARFNTGQVVFRPLAGDAPVIELLMAWRRDNTNPALEALLSTVKAKQQLMLAGAGWRLPPC
ncbi:DNA-binding transcriptional regulator HcaR [Shimwellia pseudoproteus]|uniref:DNA-binding transcriptional regulator HcaR n=1 Tax=Shimwellia pseudoproteus TaxID=570012 RepID=UPI0018ED152C|nr:DNA-binding transcriptional regulator HcaR [Shimwellia pseudoproteus]MBJ3816311.1 DNA-binding transcriptional regulator HcaR [Shimwellia pseudoproteus]